MTHGLAAQAEVHQVVRDASGLISSTWLLIAFPLLGAAVLLLGGRRLDKTGHLIGTAASCLSFVMAVALFVAMLGESGDARAFNVPLWEWFNAAGYQVEVGLLLDQLSMAFVLLITGVGSLIHVYSIGYMEHDERRRRFFGYLNLFVAAMLLLVLASDYLILFIGWEGVGLASYLLIGFWQHKPSAAVAAKKAFVVNRVGDMGMVLAIASMIVVFGSSSFELVFAGAGDAPTSWLNALGLLLLLAACGKSAQFPLQSWLLDAMEGPTPVSALIHAATMVTAGVYLVVRSAAIYDLAPEARTAVVLVGTITLLMGAIIGCAKDDIKKALAGSTMSQIGYMMLAAGLGPAGYAFAIFHLITHGFFKANMFLGAGSVMHGMNDEVNMRRFGGLRAAMPVTFLTFALGYLAIIGIPPFAGYFSKDKIIEAAFADNILIGLCALIGAGITAFYMTRVMLMTFLTSKRWAEDVHPHESPRVMTWPLIGLAALSLVGGAALLYVGGGIVEWLEPVTGEEHHDLPLPVAALIAITLVVVVAGVAVAWLLYGRRPVPVEAPAGNPLTVAARRDLYGDAVNEAVLMRPGQYLTRSLVYVENRGVDGAVIGAAKAVGGLSARWRRWQTGFVRSYALTMLTGAGLVVVAMLLVRLP
ncbi:NADH-quinone oxidoreductase subunit L [Phytoactinopolyspora alkaliphila]|uniref:NADH-quinone oxidoreductase subunit L n=1 Tax=Phytoactinopolyspora alkaliphila TaxID=1783498 RepID=A0A6N9YHW0_9ACTN|nr:NADH-quinone oxidoreductase subunit L [Phytoactinopolyspora alkaliphila]NED94510.1 NADH-quinone oxidoreductase subunit L [Phytoactinopolyspora alkaliphila]